MQPKTVGYLSDAPGGQPVGAEKSIERTEFSHLVNCGKRTEFSLLVN